MGWEDLTLDTIRPKVEELKKRRPTSSGAAISDSSSSTTLTTQSDQHYRYARSLASSPLKGGYGIFSDQVHSRNGSGSSSGHRKRNYHNSNSFENPSSSAASRKRFRSSPIVGRQSHHISWKESQSSPIKARHYNHFTGSSSAINPLFDPMESDDLPMSSFLASDDEDTLPAHSFDIRSSPPRTPPPMRTRGGGRHNKEKNGKSGEEGADLLLYLATSPSPALPRSSSMRPPSTPPQRSLALPSSMMTTPGGSSLAGFGNPSTPSQGFDFADFVNITPSPAQNGFARNSRIIKTPSSVTRRNLTFDNLIPPNASPGMRSFSMRENHPAERRVNAGLGMQLGGDLRPR